MFFDTHLTHLNTPSHCPIITNYSFSSLGKCLNAAMAENNQDQNLKQKEHLDLVFEPTTDTPYLTLTGKLWDV